MTKSVAVTFCKENRFHRKPGELSGVGLGTGDLDRLGVWAAKYADVQVTRHQLLDLLSDQERARALKQLGREGVEVGCPEVALVKNALPALLPHQPHILDRIADEAFAMTFASKEGSKGYSKARIGDKEASGPSIPWRKAPLLDEVRQKFREGWGYKFNVPVADCNLYQGEEGGMDFHGDDERNIVICLNVGKEGETRELDFQAFEEGFPVGERLSITLEHGDIYLLSEKAVGMDWRCETKITWRHAAGHKDTYRPDNEVLYQEQEKIDKKSAKVARQTKKYLDSVAANIDIGYNKLTSKETLQVIENTHKMALVGVLERMDCEEVNEKDVTGCTKLHWACYAHNPLAVAALLKIPNIDVNARNNSGYTPLMVAAAGCCVQSLKLLLEDQRVKLNVANNVGVTLDKLIGSECYLCSCSKEFKKKQTQLLQMIIDKGKEARVGSSNEGPKDVTKGVIREGKKRKVGSSKRKQKDLMKGVLREGKKRVVNDVSDDNDDEKDGIKKRKAESYLGPSLSDDYKAEDDTMVKIEESENTSSKEKDTSPHTSSENHYAKNSSERTANCKNLKAKIKYKNFSDISRVEPVPFKEETFATDFKTEYIEKDIKTEDTECFSDRVSSDQFFKTEVSKTECKETDLKIKCFESHFKTGKVDTDIQIDSFETVVKKGLKEECMNKDVKTDYNEENLKMERFGKNLNMDYNVKLEEFKDDENNEIKIRLGKKKKVESNDSDFVKLKRKKSSKTTSKHAVNNESESDLSFDMKNINPSKTIKSGSPKAQVSYIVLEGEDDESSHTREKPYNCEQCTKTFSTSSLLNRHNKIHTGEKPHHCSFCTKSFSKSSNLKVHERTHTGEKPFACNICPKTFISSSHLSLHNKTHTGEKSHHCSFCTKSFSESSHLKVHERTHTGEKPFPCKICPKTFGSASHLSKHNKSHTGEKPHHCSFCTKSFSWPSQLKDHKRTHTGEKPFPCKICPKTFSQPSCLKIHERFHTGEKPFPCKICPKTFVSASHLSTHNKRSHTGEKPHQ